LAVLVLPTGFVVTVNCAELAPPITVTLGGTLTTAGLVAERDTTTPPAGAVPFKFTVPVVELPPLTLLGDNVSEEIARRFTVRVAVLVTPP
jgi:hypothetical protein